MKEEKRKKKSSAGKIIARVTGRIAAVAGGTVLIVVLGLYAVMWTFCHGPSESARNLFVSTVLETGALKFLANVYFSKEEILEITGNNTMKYSKEDVDPDLIVIASDNGSDGENAEDAFDYDENGVCIIELSGRSYYAKLMIIKDPSKVRVGTIYPWSDENKSKEGMTLDELVKYAGAIGGVNGGEYQSDGNWGGRPKGLVVSDGQILYNVPQYGDVMVGFNEDNILVIKEIGNMTAGEIETMVREERIRDCVSFKDVDDGNTNHFTKLIINGTAREINGSGSGANPRTAVGQRADGAVLLLVTDGRGTSGHIGATAADLISVMQQYGAVNAANIDGGSSSAMYYNGVFEMTSVTFYFATSSWKLPTAFVFD